MSKTEVQQIALEAYRKCLDACAKFDGEGLLELGAGPTRVWWKETFENHAEELAERIRTYLSQAQLTSKGCLELNPHEDEPARLQWRGHRQKVYQLIAWGLEGKLPRKRSVVRHLCGNRKCIHPDHLRVGTQAQNLLDQRRHRNDRWSHL